MSSCSKDEITCDEELKVQTGTLTVIVTRSLIQVEELCNNILNNMMETPSY